MIQYTATISSRQDTSRFVGGYHAEKGYFAINTAEKEFSIEDMLQILREVYPQIENVFANDDYGIVDGEVIFNDGDLDFTVINSIKLSGLLEAGARAYRRKEAMNESKRTGKNLATLLAEKECLARSDVSNFLNPMTKGEQSD